MSNASVKHLYLALSIVLLLVLVTAYAAVPALADTWSKANTDGFNDSNNSYLLSMAEYGTYLYAGTSNVSTGAQLYRSSNGSSWSPVTIDSPEFAGNVDIASMAVFNSRLYAGTRKGSGCEVWEYDGTTWQQRASGGFGVANSDSVTSLRVFGSYLYAGLQNLGGGCRLWRTIDGTTWTQVVGQDPPGTYGTGPGFGDVGNNSAMSMAVFDGVLYAGTYNASTGAEVWKSSNGTTWNKSNADGFYGGNKNTQAASMAVFRGELFAGTFNTSGGEVWETTDGTIWNRVVEKGFETGDHAVQSLAVFNGALYAGTWGCRVLKSGDGANWTQTNTSKFGDSNNGETPCLSVFQGQLYAATGNFSTGCELWRTIGAPTVSSVSPSSGPPGTSVTINGYSFGDTRGSGSGTSQGTGDRSNGMGASYVSFNGVVATAYAKWSDTEIVCTVPNGASSGPVSVVVNGQSSNKNNAFTVASPTWYLAEGTTAWGFNCYITIENPNTSVVNARVTYMPTGAANKTETVTLPASSQTTLTNDHLLSVMGGQTDFSTRVQCLDATKSIAVDRTMFWSSSRKAEPEAHSSIGVTSPATTWYLPEGSSSWGFECWLLIQNPNAGKASCKVTYMIEGESPRSFTKEVAAHSRASFDMAADIGAKDASIKVTSVVPVIPERAMYRNGRSEGHDSIGTTSPATDYFLAEGTTAWGFTTYVLVQNPNSSAANVTLTYMTNSGPSEQPPFSMPPNSRKTIKVNDVLPDRDFSTRVHGSAPIIAERAMYWYSEDVEICHDSIGMDRPHTCFYLPDGDATANFGVETWTLVQNPNSSPVVVEITYMTPSGTGNVAFTDTIPANSRKTYDMGEKIAGSKAAIMVRSKTTGKKIMVERAMYWANRSAGTDTIGGYSD